jgi:hypothetical protein
MSFPRTLAKGVGLIAAGVSIFALASGGTLTTFGMIIALVGWFYVAAYLTSTPARHWRSLNVFLRLISLGFTFTALAFIGWAIYYLLDPKFAEGLETLSGSAPVDAFAVAALALFFGIFLLTRRCSRPDLGDVAFSDRAMRLLWGLPPNWRRPVARGREDQRWWTGDASRSQQPRICEVR